jgi:hypothetical protein
MTARPLTSRPDGRSLRDVPHDGPIPLDALRDLIALTRALYVTFKGLGKGYDQQLDKAQKGGPGTWNHKTAWLMAEEATIELGNVVDVFLPAKAVITASGERLLKKR